MKYLLSALCWITRRFRRLPGRWRLLIWLKPRVKEQFQQPSPSVVKLTCGYKIRVDKHDFIGRRIYITGEYETATSRVFRELIRPGDHVLDIGANIGYFSLLALSLVKPSGQVYAFEASPHIAALLRKNILLNGIESNFDLIEQAVSNKGGSLTFYESDDDHLGISSLRNLGDRTKSSFVVPAVAIDEIASRFDTVRLIKIDVEGAELLALEGMRNLLLRDRPYVIFELTDIYLKEVYGSRERVISFLEELDYGLFLIEEEGLTVLDELARKQCNVLAAPKGSSIPGR